MRVSKVSMAAGEVSPRLYGRSDTRFSEIGLSYASNVLILKEGGCVKRGGLEYVCDAISDTTKSRIIPYDFGLSQTYIYELGVNAIRFVTSGAQVELSGSPVEVTTTYAEADLFSIGYASAGDVMGLCTWAHPPKDLTRASATSWTFTDTSFAVATTSPTISSVTTSGSSSSDTPVALPASYVVTAIDDATGEESLPSAAVSSGGSGNDDEVTVSWAHVSGCTYYNIYKEEDGVYGYVGRASGTSGTVTFDDIGYDPDETDTPPAARNPFNSAGDYPETITYHQQRRVFASTENDPALVEMSRSALFNNFSVSEPGKATDAIITGVYGQEVQRVRHLLPLEELFVMTANLSSQVRPVIVGEGSWIIRGDDESVLKGSEAPRISPSQQQRAIYVAKGGTIVRDLSYQFTSNDYPGRDLTATASHLFESATVVDMAYQALPDYAVWFVMSDGTALSLTYMPEHEVFGWARHSTDGLFESVAVINEGAYDAPYFVVKRSTGRFIERMRERDDSALANGFYIDSGLTYSGSPTTTVTGLDHLEGEDVIALADGDVVRGLTVSSGSVSLPTAASLVHVGLEYAAEVRSLPYLPETQRGSAGAANKAARNIAYRVMKTNSFQGGVLGSSLETLVPKQPENWGDAATPTSGVVRLPAMSTWDTDQVIVAKSSDPIHFELLAMYPDWILGS